MSTEGKRNKLGNLSAEVADLTEKMRPFLSRFHGKAHSWWCQVLSIKLLFINLIRLTLFFSKILWFGHWRKGGAATVGEEQEQRFANQSRYSSSTKRMSSTSKG